MLGHSFEFYILITREENKMNSTKVLLKMNETISSVGMEPQEYVSIEIVMGVVFGVLFIITSIIGAMQGWNRRAMMTIQHMLRESFAPWFYQANMGQRGGPPVPPAYINPVFHCDEEPQPGDASRPRASPLQNTLEGLELVV